MKEKSLIQFIKNYHKNPDVKVSIHTKDGLVFDMSCMNISNNNFFNNHGTQIPFSNISYAEITSI